MGRLATLWRGVGVALIALGAALGVLGLPAVFVLGLEPPVVSVVRFVVSGGLYVFAGLLLHPEAWERTPFNYPAVRAPMMAFLPFAAATAVWG